MADAASNVSVAGPAPARPQATGGSRRRDALRGAPKSLLFGGALLAAMVLLSFAGPLVLGGDPKAQNLTAYLQAPSLEHPFGTDATGRDVFTRVMHGGRPSLLIAGLGMLASISLGVLVGMLAAFGGRAADRIAGFSMDIQLALPYVIVAIVLVSVAGTSIPLLILMMALAGWVQVARVVRSIALRERSKDYVKAAVVVGASQRRIATRYVFPTVLPAVLVLAPLQMAAMLVIEATLSFLGMGIQPPSPSWGSIMLEGKDYVSTAWWLTACPGIAILLTALSLILIGDGLQRERGSSLDRLSAAEADA